MLQADANWLSSYSLLPTCLEVSHQDRHRELGSLLRKSEMGVAHPTCGLLIQNTKEILHLLKIHCFGQVLSFFINYLL